MGDVKLPSAENPQLANLFPLKPGAGQNIAMHALPAARHFFLVLISAFDPFIFIFFLQTLSLLVNYVILIGNRVFSVGLQNKIGHPAHHHKWFKQVPLESVYII